MKNALKIAAVVLVLLAVGVGGAALYIWRGVRAVPAFYTRAPLEGAQRLDAIASFERKVIHLHGALDAADARGRRAERAGRRSAQEPTEPEVAGGPVRVSFTAAELDTYFRKWLRDGGYLASLESHLADPRIALRDGEIIFAGRSAELGSVVSFHFRPWVGDDGQTRVRLAGVYAGVVPLPRRLVEPLRARAAGALEADLDAYRDEAGLTGRGAANGALATFVTRSQILKLLREQDLSAAMLFPSLVTGDGHVPARVESLTVTPEAAEVGLHVLTPAERRALVDLVREPEATVAGGE